MTTYKESGVDVDAGDDAVDRIKPIVQQTFTPGVLAGIGSFGSYVELDAENYNAPVLVSSIDGVGTKVNVAMKTGRFDTVGQDLVNHCVNDIAMCGASPLYFLDYYGVGKLDPAVTEEVVTGFAIACKKTGTALVGGEIAEMPDVYGDEHFDLVGCIVGVVEKDKIMNGSTTEPGDVLIGLPSTGLHTNGYTLARTVLFDAFSVDDTPDELGGETVGEALLRVHRSYLVAIQALVADVGVAPRGFAHITGGGLPGNLRRIMPDGRTAVVDYDAWERPPLFSLIQDLGDVPEQDMRRTFNCGMGLVGAFPANQKDAVLEAWRGLGEDPVVIGRVEAV